MSNTINLPFKVSYLTTCLPDLARAGARPKP